jgi:hypothetical protein
LIPEPDACDVFAEAQSTVGDTSLPPEWFQGTKRRPAPTTATADTVDAATVDIELGGGSGGRYGSQYGSPYEGDFDGTDSDVAMLGGGEAGAAVRAGAGSGGSMHASGAADESTRQRRDAAETAIDAMTTATTTGSGSWLGLPREQIATFEHVCFAYPTRPLAPVLRDFNLQVFRGETVAIVGVSGGGKSTLFNLMLRLYEASSGTITVAGADIKTLGVKDLRRQFGVVSQEPKLFQATVAENITYGVEGKISFEVEHAAKLAGVCGHQSLSTNYLLAGCVLFCFVLFCFALFCFVLLCFVLVWFGFLFYFILFCFVLFCFSFVSLHF